ncbi:MAG: polysaccharide pyruvyl transferase family protein [bacterium]
MIKDKGKKHRILISGGYGNGNAGDEALLITMLEHLRNELGDDCEIKIFSDDVSYSCKRFKEHFIYSGGRGIFEEDKKGLSSIQWFYRNIRAIIWCDLFITGGGTILQDSTNIFFIPFWLSKIFLAMVFRKKTMMYGIGVGPMNSQLMRFLSKIIVNRMDLITLRGKLSYYVLRDMNVKRPSICITADPAVALKPSPEVTARKILKSEGIDINCKFVGFCVRQWYITHRKSLRGKPYWSEENRRKYEGIIESFAKIADHIIARHKRHILFIPMSIVGTKDDRAAANDIAGKMIQRLEYVHIIKGDYSPQDIKCLIGQCSALIAMRLHSAIFAVPLRVPLIPIAYGMKMEDFMGEFGLGDHVIRLDGISDDDLLTRVDEVLMNPQDFIAPESKIEDAIYKALQNSSLAVQLLKSIRALVLKSILSI